MSSFEILKVTWVSVRKFNEWYPSMALREFSYAVIETVGFGYELPDRVVLAGDYHSATQGVPEMFRYVCSLPKAAILKVERLRVE